MGLRYVEVATEPAHATWPGSFLCPFFPTPPAKFSCHCYPGPCWGMALRGPQSSHLYTEGSLLYHVKPVPGMLVGPDRQAKFIIPFCQRRCSEQQGK